MRSSSPCALRSTTKSVRVWVAIYDDSSCRGGGRPSGQSGQGEAVEGGSGQRSGWIGQGGVCRLGGHQGKGVLSCGRTSCAAQLAQCIKQLLQCPGRSSGPRQQGSRAARDGAAAGGAVRTAPSRNRMMKVVAMEMAAPDSVASVRSLGSLR